MNQHYVVKLKNYLQTHEIYVKISRAVRMIRDLYNTAHEEEQIIWPQIELARQIEAGNFHSILVCSTFIQASITISVSSISVIIPTFSTISIPTLISTSTPAPSIIPTLNSQLQQHVFIQPLKTLLTLSLSGLGQRVANLAKLYTEEQKYSSENDNFEYKLNIFNNTCKQADLSVKDKTDALSQMLKNLALDFFFSTLNNHNLNFDQMCEAMIAHFEKEE